MHYEGTTLGFSMFDANRQAIAKFNVHFKDGHSFERVHSHVDAFPRMSPLKEFYAMKAFCRVENVERVEWSMMIAVNGGPFTQVVNTTDGCSLEYDAWSHNSWILLDGRIEGYPDYNLYSPTRESGSPLPQVYPEPKVIRGVAELWLRDHVAPFSAFYLILSLLVGGSTLAPLMRRRSGAH
jgi:hypothetical protein